MPAIRASVHPELHPPTHFFARKVSNISDQARRSRMLSFSFLVYIGCKHSVGGGGPADSP